MSLQIIDSIVSIQVEQQVKEIITVLKAYARRHYFWSHSRVYGLSAGK